MDCLVLGKREEGMQQAMQTRSKMARRMENVSDLVGSHTLG